MANYSITKFFHSTYPFFLNIVGESSPVTGGPPYSVEKLYLTTSTTSGYTTSYLGQIYISGIWRGIDTSYVYHDGWKIADLVSLKT